MSSTTIVEDRILARVARDAVALHNASASPADRAEIALGRAVTALRAMGVAATREVTRVMRDDIALLLAETPEPRPTLLAA